MSRLHRKRNVISRYVPRASGGEPPEADITEQMRQRSLREWG